MIRSLRTGVSGLKSNQIRMDVIGNNISNVNTIAFKRSRAAFQEMLGQQLLGVGRTAGGSGINPSFVGLGVSVGSIDQNWGQGALENTNIATDLALDGDGFFIARSGDQNLLTRAGNFTFNRNGELVTATGLNVQGWAFEDDTLVDGTLQDIKMDINATAPPKLTENVFIGGNLSADKQQAVTTEITVDGTLDGTASSGDTISQDVTVYDANGDPIDVSVRFTATGNPDEWTVDFSTDGGATYTAAGTVTIGTDTKATLADALGAGEDLTLDFSDMTSDNTSAFTSATQNGDPKAKETVSSVVYDAKGQAHKLAIEYVRTDQNTWKYTVTDGDTGSALSTGNLVFNSDGTLNSTLSDVDGNSELEVTWDMDGDGNDETLTLDFQSEKSKLTQYAGSTTATAEQDGFASGTLLGFGINQEGILELNFSNGQQQKIYQMAIGNVNNPNGLQQSGDNFYSLTSASGDLQVGKAGRDLRTSVIAGTLEMSNVDLATEFTDMIVTQRGFQASARVITTSDELLQETVQLKR